MTQRDQMSTRTGDLIPTPGQTVGPFFDFGLRFDRCHELVPPGSPGAIRFHGAVLDGAGNPVPDALLEVTQADAEGRVQGHPGTLSRDGLSWSGWGRALTSYDGYYSFTTVAPGATTPNRAPFLAMAVFARGLLNRLFTRAYLPIGEDLLSTDPLLASLPQDRRDTLVAVPEPGGHLRFDIRLQGVGETVFLRYPRHHA